MPEPFKKIQNDLTNIDLLFTAYQIFQHAHALSLALIIFSVNFHHPKLNINPENL